MKHFFVVPHTHWDREWYLPYQEFRARLVRMIDKLLAIMESDEEFRFFVLDGQTVVLEDYLEMRPENKTRLEALAKAGRLLVGPWYVLPDEFLVTGEAIVRNLLLGAAIARDYGGRMPVGYLPDQFGHIAQMPQILQLAGLETAVLWRGVPPEITQNEFRWVALDGSEVFCVYLSQSYSNGVNLPLDPVALESRLEDIAARLAPYDRTGLLLVMNGSDHRDPQAGLPQALAAVRRPDWQLEITSLPAYVEKARAARAGTDAANTPKEALPVWRGELRSPARAPMLVGVSSTRIGQKIRHFRLAILLEKRAEPAAAWAWLTGSRYPAQELYQAWKYLLQNEPHDSICGCSVDQVHREMETRFDWGEQIAGILARTAEEELAARINQDSAPARADGLADDGKSVVVFNLGGPGGPAVIEGMLAAAEAPLEAVTPSGTVLPVQVATAAGASPTGRPVVLVDPDLPAGGFRTYRLRTARAGKKPAARPFLSVRIAPAELANEFFALSVNPDGSLRLTDRRTGVVYPSINRFVDGGDAGDEYNYSPPARDHLVMAPSGDPLSGSSAAVQVTVVEDGPVRATLAICPRYRVPAGLSEDRQERDRDHYVELPIITRVSLYAGLPRIDFATTIENRARDHRLRVHFDTPFTVTGAVAETQFGVVERPVAENSDAGFAEVPQGTKPSQGFVDISDGRAGLGIMSRGLPEYEVVPGKEGGSALALTLLRAVGWLSRGDLAVRRGHAGPGYPTPDAQCLGTHTFEYAVLPHAGSWLEADLPTKAWAYKAPPILLALPSPQEERPGPLPPEGSFLRVTPSAVQVSAVKKAEATDELIVRIFNDSPAAVTARVNTILSLVAWRRVSLMEEATSPEAGPPCTLTLQPWEIATLALALSAGH